MTSLQNFPATTWRDKLKYAAGYGLSRLHSRRTRQIYRRPEPQVTGLVDRALLAFLKQRCRKEGRSRFFARYHRSFWSGRGGAVYAENCDYRFQDIFLSQHRDAVTELEAAWAKLPQIKRVVEIGTGSGKLLAFLQERHPELEALVGLDINAAQIERNRATYAQSGLEFHACDAQDWIRRKGQPGTVFVTNCGVLEYFPQGDLEKLLAHICRQLSPALFLAIEPLAVDHDLDHSLLSQTFGDELSFSHNYPHLFTKSGFHVAYQRESFFERYRTVILVATAV